MTATIRNSGFCLMIDALFEGTVPSLTDGEGRAWVFPTRIAAEREVADILITRLQDFLDGDRDFEDAMTVEETVVEVEVSDDGSFIITEDGRFPCHLAEPCGDHASTGVNSPSAGVVSERRRDTSLG